MKSTVEVLREARALIENPERWTQGALARFGNNHICEPRDKRATCWCAIGAARRVGDDDREPAESVLKQAAHRVAVPWPLICTPAAINDWNGRATHGRVMELYDRAIELAEAES